MSTGATFEESFYAGEEAALGFLVVEHGFCATRREFGRGDPQRGVHGRAVYRAGASAATSEREVVLSVAPLRLQLDLHLSGGGSGVAYTIEELHAVDGRAAFPQRMHGLYDAMHNPDQLLAEFMRLAGVLRGCGRRFFDDEPSLWDELEARRDSKARLEHVRETLAFAKESFHRADWPRVIALLSPIESHLGEMASARLAYARRKQRRLLAKP